MKRLLIFIGLLILVAGCSSIQANQPPHKTYVQTMMKSDKCTNACWLGIEVGMKIESKDAFVVLGNYYGNKNLYYPYYPNTKSSVGWITWDKNISPLFLEKGDITFTDKSQVDLITIMFSNNQIPIADLVEVFGKPEITIIKNKNEEGGLPLCGLWKLFYPQKGLVIIVDGDYVGVMYIIQPYPASTAEVSKEQEYASKESIINWDERDKYCTHSTPSSP